MPADHVHYDMHEQVIQCAICGRLELPEALVPANRFLAMVSSFQRHHRHQELTPQQRQDAVRWWRGDLEG